MAVSKVERTAADLVAQRAIPTADYLDDAMGKVKVEKRVVL